VLKYVVAPLPGLIWIVVAVVVHAWHPRNDSPPLTLPAAATRQLAGSLRASASTTSHVWRDVPPLNEDGTVNAYIEISRGDLRKWEFDMRSNERAIDRVMPPEVGGYPVNYGFVPQTVSYDGDPFDALVLGPPIEGGTLVRGIAVAVLHMTDEKGLDSKVVLSTVGSDGRPLEALAEDDRERLEDYFGRYKRHERGKFSVVHGWDTRAVGLAFVKATHAFFRECGTKRGSACSVRP
jgi:inorganic pyrophosphatase